MFSRVSKKHEKLFLLKMHFRARGDISISEDDCDFLDSIYLPSKYPLGNALPFYQPDLKTCNNAIDTAENTFKFVSDMLKR